MKTETKTAAPKRGSNTFLFNVNELTVKDGFNVRQDYGNMDELVASIKEHGIQNPIKYRTANDGTKFLVDGHRRLRAATILAEQGIDIMVPSTAMPRSANEVDDIIMMYTTALGKPLTPIEKSDLVHRLTQYGLADKVIAEKLSITTAEISNLRLLRGIPEELKQLVSDDTVKATLVLQMMRENKNDGEKVLALVKEVKDTVKVLGRSKVNRKDITNASGKVNSSVLFKKVTRNLGEPTKDVDLHETIRQVIDGELTEEQITGMFWGE